MKEVPEVPPDVLIFENLKDWIYRNRLILLFVFTGVIFLTILLYNLQGRSDAKALLAEREYLQFSSSNDPKALDKLIALVEKNPSLKGKYDALIAKALLGAGKEDQAIPFMNRTLSFLQQEAPHYASFAKTSILMEQKAWSGALLEAEKLKQQMLGVDKEDLLYSFNQMRIALLHKKLGNDKAELQAWEELEQHLGLNREGAEKNEFLNAFQENGLTLKEYIASRKKALNLVK